jgi:hypothetical protein
MLIVADDGTYRPSGYQTGERYSHRIARDVLAATIGATSTTPALLKKK